MAIDGISRLISITQMKASNANDEAMSGAAKQRDLIEQQRRMAGLQGSAFDQQKRMAGQQGSAIDRKRSIEQQTWTKLEPAALELKQRLPAFQRTLSPAAAALFDKWLEWASQHR